MKAWDDARTVKNQGNDSTWPTDFTSVPRQKRIMRFDVDQNAKLEVRDVFLGTIYIMSVFVPPLEKPTCTLEHKVH